MIFDGVDVVENDVSTEYWDKSGLPTHNPSFGVACVSNTNSFIKFNRSGSIFDPHDLYYKEGDECQLDDRHGGYVFNYKSVNEETFRVYIKYLLTGRQSLMGEVKRRIV